MKKSDDILINEMVYKLKALYKPELVMLFGSKAEGSDDAESDIDLLIVKQTKKRPLWRRIEVRKILGTDQPLDVIVYTPDEFSQLKKSERSSILYMLKNGKILFEKKKNSKNR